MLKWQCQDCESSLFEILRDPITDDIYIECWMCGEALDPPNIKLFGTGFHKE